MSEHFKETIKELQAKLAEQERAAIETKRLINQLSAFAGLPVPYGDADLQLSAAPSGMIRSDQFYGQPLAKAVREVLQIRRASGNGPASVNDLHQALLQGGYRFETRNTENAKRALRISLTKNTALFHRLPNGLFGLLEWYPKFQRKAESGVATAEDKDEAENEADADEKSEKAAATANEEAG